MRWLPLFYVPVLVQLPITLSGFTGEPAVLHQPGLSALTVCLPLAVLPEGCRVHQGVHLGPSRLPGQPTSYRKVPVLSRSMSGEASSGFEQAAPSLMLSAGLHLGGVALVVPMSLLGKKKGLCVQGLGDRDHAAATNIPYMPQPPQMCARLTRNQASGSMRGAGLKLGKLALFVALGVPMTLHGLGSRDSAQLLSQSRASVVGPFSCRNLPYTPCGPHPRPVPC